MRIQLLGLASVLALGSGLHAQQILQMDVNDLSYQVTDAQGNPASFGGVTHSGTVSLFDGANAAIQGVLKKSGPGFPFIADPLFTASLSSMSLDINLSGGLVTGGSLSVSISSGDTYTAILDASGQVRTTVIGGFTIDAATLQGTFSDSNFGGSDITSWFNAQGGAGALFGNLLTFKFNPSPDGTGVADVDLFVSDVPAPAGAALLGLAGLFAGRRRR